MKSSRKTFLGCLGLFILLIWIVIIALVVSKREIDLGTLFPPAATSQPTPIPPPSPTPVACTDENKRVFAREAMALVYNQDSDMDVFDYAVIFAATDVFPEDDPVGGYVYRANIRSVDLESIPFPACISQQKDALIYVFDEFRRGVSALHSGDITGFKQHLLIVADRIDPAIDAILIMLP